MVKNGNFHIGTGHLVVKNDNLKLLLTSKGQAWYSFEFITDI